MRDWMIKLRQKKGLTLRDAAVRCDVSYRLLQNIEEDDWITHPKIADKVAAGYGMNTRQRNALCAQRHRVVELDPEPEVATGDGHEPLIKIDVKQIAFLMRSKHMSKAGISTQLAYNSSWLFAAMRRGTMKPSDVRRVAHVLGAKPDQLKAAKSAQSGEAVRK